MQMNHRLAEVVEMMLLSDGMADRNPSMDTMATIIAFPNRDQRAARSVLVVRKSVRSPFERKQARVVLFAT